MSEHPSNKQHTDGKHAENTDKGHYHTLECPKHNAEINPKLEKKRPPWNHHFTKGSIFDDNNPDENKQKEKEKPLPFHDRKLCSRTRFEERNIAGYVCRVHVDEEELKKESQHFTRETISSSLKVNEKVLGVSVPGIKKPMTSGGHRLTSDDDFGQRSKASRKTKSNDKIHGSERKVSEHKVDSHKKKPDSKSVTEERKTDQGHKAGQKLHEKDQSRSKSKEAIGGDLHHKVEATKSRSNHNTDSTSQKKLAAVGHESPLHELSLSRKASKESPSRKASKSKDKIHSNTESREESPSRKASKSKDKIHTNTEHTTEVQKIKSSEVHKIKLNEVHKIKSSESNHNNDKKLCKKSSSHTSKENEVPVVHHLYQRKPSKSKEKINQEEIAAISKTTVNNKTDKQKITLDKKATVLTKPDVATKVKTDIMKNISNLSAKKNSEKSGIDLHEHPTKSVSFKNSSKIIKPPSATPAKKTVTNTSINSTVLDEMVDTALQKAKENIAGEMYVKLTPEQKHIERMSRTKSPISSPTGSRSKSPAAKSKKEQGTPVETIVAATQSEEHKGLVQMIETCLAGVNPLTENNTKHEQDANSKPTQLMADSESSTDEIAGPIHEVIKIPSRPKTAVANTEIPSRRPKTAMANMDYELMRDA